MTPSPSDPPPFDVWTTRTDTGTRIVHVGGEVDIATAPAVAAALQERIDGEARLVLDLTATDFLDSSGIRVLVQAHRAGVAEGVPFAVVPGPPAIQSLLVTTGVAEHLTLLDEPPAA